MADDNSKPKGADEAKALLAIQDAQAAQEQHMRTALMLALGNLLESAGFFDGDEPEK
jgi:hypothetical protein